MQILWAWDWNLNRDDNVLSEQTKLCRNRVHHPFSICWDSSRVLWKRLFHLAVDRFINNTAVHCRDLDSVSNRAPQPMIIIIHWQAEGSLILFSDVSKTVKCEKTKSKKNKTSPNFQSRQRGHLKPHTDHQAYATLAASVCHSRALALLTQTVYP